MNGRIKLFLKRLSQCFAMITLPISIVSLLLVPYFFRNSFFIGYAFWFIAIILLLILNIIIFRNVEDKIDYCLRVIFGFIWLPIIFINSIFKNIKLFVLESFQYDKKPTSILSILFLILSVPLLPLFDLLREYVFYLYIFNFISWIFFTVFLFSWASKPFTIPIKFIRFSCGLFYKAKKSEFEDKAKVYVENIQNSINKEKNWDALVNKYIELYRAIYKPKLYFSNYFDSEKYLWIIFSIMFIISIVLLILSSSLFIFNFAKEGLVKMDSINYFNSIFSSVNLHMTLNIEGFEPTTLQSKIFVIFEIFLVFLIFTLFILRFSQRSVSAAKEQIDLLCSSFFNEQIVIIKRLVNKLGFSENNFVEIESQVNEEVLKKFQDKMKEKGIEISELNPSISMTSDEILDLIKKIGNKNKIVGNKTE
jgi:hypothetical protein